MQWGRCSTRPRRPSGSYIGSTDGAQSPGSERELEVAYAALRPLLVPEMPWVWSPAYRSQPQIPTGPIRCAPVPVGAGVSRECLAFDTKLVRRRRAMVMGNRAAILGALMLTLVAAPALGQNVKTEKTGEAEVRYSDGCVVYYG